MGVQHLAVPNGPGRLAVLRPVGRETPHGHPEDACEAMRGERGIDRVASLRQDRRDFLAAIESAAQKPMIPADMFPDPLLTNGGGYEEPHAA